KRILASPYRPLIGRPAPAAYQFFLDHALDGRLAVSRPFARESPQAGTPDGPTMFVAAPVRSTNDQVVAVLGLRIKPEEEFSRIFSVARMGQSGETYAFDRRGVMLTASRFDQELQAQGLIPNVPGSTAILNLRLVDPTTRQRDQQGRPSLRLTRMAGAAVRGIDGCDVDGYPNYRGVYVVGAWAWLPEFQMGIATEVAAEEAYHTLYMLRQAFMVLFLLLVLSGAGIFAFTLLVERLRASLRRNMEARRLGQYALLQEIGRGANGMVYRARHALLRRPVAIKLLSPELTDHDSAARFEQEVQMTSQLTHPNTVAVYDYGRTPDGLFYYAMEFLEGIDLHRLVRQFGPQPEGRVIHILRQVCGSLGEAHSTGIIHRDIKPANIVLTRRGGVCDMVKVLDFGLVKPVHREAGHDESVVGTPHFMSPEAVEEPEKADARSDLYSLGAVAYWLLTGHTLFEDLDISQLLEKQAKAEPVRVSERAGRPVAGDLEFLVMWCLEKTPANRPRNALVLEQALGRCHAAGSWGGEQAEHWWRENIVEPEPISESTLPEKTLIIAPRPVERELS
ncbi:MAG TPA: serine/threonine protein kinase, partial [Clostridia bacterium]|nr:serine/threonine protein kinase [Clostridia bacterium]